MYCFIVIIIIIISAAPNLVLPPAQAQIVPPQAPARNNLDNEAEEELLLNLEQTDDRALAELDLED